MAINAEERWAIWGRDGGYCGICYEPVPYRQMHLDHIVPVSLGGGDEPSNLRPAHAKCNIGRGNGRVARTVARRPGRDGQIRYAKLVRFPSELEAWLRDEAKRERRSLNAQVLLILDEMRERYEAAGADLPPAS